MTPKGEGRIFQRAARWWIAYYGPDPERPGRAREYRESSRATDPERAKALLKKRLREIAGERFVAPAQERVSIGELLNRYRDHLELRGVKSRPKALSYITRVRECFGELRALDITSARLETWVKERLAEGYARATVRQYIAVLRAAMRRAVKVGDLSRLPGFPSISVKNARRGFFETEEFEAVARYLGAPWSDIARFGYLTGWRLGEILDLRWKTVDRRGGVLLLPDSKTGEARTVPLVGDLAALIERRWQARKVGTVLVPWVFHRWGRRIRSFRKRWNSACVKAGLFGVVSKDGRQRRVPTRIFHDLRRTAVRDMVRADVPETVAMSISGHRTRHIFDRYNIASLKDQQEAFARLAEHRTGQRRPAKVAR